MVTARRRHETEATVRRVNVCQRGVYMLNVFRLRVIEVERAIIDVQLLLFEAQLTAELGGVLQQLRGPAAGSREGANTAVLRLPAAHLAHRRHKVARQPQVRILVNAHWHERRPWAAELRELRMEDVTRLYQRRVGMREAGRAAESVERFKFRPVDAVRKLVRQPQHLHSLRLEVELTRLEAERDVVPQVFRDGKVAALIERQVARRCRFEVGDRDKDVSAEPLVGNHLVEQHLVAEMHLPRRHQPGHQRGRLPVGQRAAERLPATVREDDAAAEERPFR